MPDTRHETEADKILSGQIGLLKHPMVEVRVVAAQVLSEAKIATAAPEFIRMLDDASGRVQFSAAMALAKLGTAEAVGPIVAMLEKNADHDPFQAKQRRAFQGRSFALIKANKSTGQITVTASAPGLAGAEITIGVSR